MKYIIMMFGDQATMTEVRSTDWIKAMIRFMGDIEKELADAGELVASEGLADPSQAKRSGSVPTDGPFAEANDR